MRTVFKYIELLPDHSLREECSNKELFLVRIFLVFGLNTGKYRPERTPYLDTFQAAIHVIIYD